MTSIYLFIYQCLSRESEEGEVYAAVLIKVPRHSLLQRRRGRPLRRALQRRGRIAAVHVNTDRVEGARGAALVGGPIFGVLQEALDGPGRPPVLLGARAQGRQGAAAAPRRDGREEREAREPARGTSRSWGLGDAVQTDIPGLFGAQGAFRDVEWSTKGNSMAIWFAWCRDLHVKDDFRNGRDPATGFPGRRRVLQ